MVTKARTGNANEKTRMKELEVPYSQTPNRSTMRGIKEKNAAIERAKANLKQHPSNIGGMGDARQKTIGKMDERARAAHKWLEARGKGGDYTRQYGLPLSHPHDSKGCIIVETPTSPLEIYFSRYPTQYAMGITANLGRQVIPGASTEAFQKLGAKATEFKMQVLFHNAWLGPEFIKAGTALSLLTQAMKELWAGDTWWKLGRSSPKKIIITKMGFTVSDFYGDEMRPHYPKGQPQNPVKMDEPQKVVVEIAFVLDEGVQAVVPFKPRRKGGGGKAKTFVELAHEHAQTAIGAAPFAASQIPFGFDVSGGPRTEAEMMGLTDEDRFGGLDADMDYRVDSSPPGESRILRLGHFGSGWPGSGRPGLKN